MLLLVTTLCITIISNGMCQDCNIKSNIFRLKKDIFCGYDKGIRPVKNDSQAVEVQLMLWIKYIEVHDYSGSINIYVHNWMVLEWTDQFLRWNPEKYDNIDTLHIESDLVWSPDIVQIESNDMGYTEQTFGDTKCYLYSSGKVTCVPAVIHQGPCTTDFTNWPFDTHKCTLEFTSWGHFDDKINLTTWNTGYSLSENEPNAAWHLVDISVSRFIRQYYKERGNAIVKYDFTIKRHSGLPTAIIFVPSLVMAVLLLSVFWIAPDVDNRIYMGCMNIFSHILYLQYLGYTLPIESENCPKIVFFYQDSLLMAGFSVMITVVLRNCNKYLTVPPARIITCFKYIEANKAGPILLYPHFKTKVFNEDVETSDNQLVTAQQDTTKVNWNIIVCLLDRIIFYMFLFVYLFLLIFHVPLP